MFLLLAYYFYVFYVLCTVLEFQIASRIMGNLISHKNYFDKTIAECGVTWVQKVFRYIQD